MSNLNYISNRLSLREPQRKSLEILADLVEDEIILSDLDLDSALNKIKAKFPIFKDFERDFINICFSLATGVGKTRLMGAFISYLFKEKGINNFFVLAPNLTIYEKLKADFTTISSPKYVFRGIDCFTIKSPVIVTGDDYEFKSAVLANRRKDTVLINIFNISKLNSEAKTDKNSSMPRIKRLSEILGKSYFEFLQNLKNLVIIMDEAHRYRADRGISVINELKPVLGLELTATPILESKSKNAEKKFQNIVYEYSLAKAIRDGFVKEPAIATRKNFDPEKHSEEEIEKIKLEDAVQIHRKTKEQLKAYCYENSLALVKPFILVACKDTEHANTILNYVKSKEFFDGYFNQRAIEIHTKVTDDEFFRELSKIERPENTVEIVIHVNKLREGWDVNNLFTIVPLRASVSQTLTEQTIGRGLRLPFGKRTYDPIIDRLTIIAHDNYEKLITEANKGDSLINKNNFIEIDKTELNEKSFYIPSYTALEETYSINLLEAEKLTETEKEDYLVETVEQKIITDIVKEKITEKPEQLFNPNLYKNHLNSINESIIKNAYELGLNLESRDKVNKMIEEKFTDFQSFSDKVSLVKNKLEENKNLFIKIPKIVRQPISSELDFSIRKFTLNLMPFLRFNLIDQNILIEALRRDEDTIIYRQEIEKINFSLEDKLLKNEIISHLINYPEIDYDSQFESIYALLDELFKYFHSNYAKQKDITNIVLYYRKEISAKLYEQIKENLQIPETLIETKFNGSYHQEIKRPNGANTKESRNYLESIEETSSDTFRRISFKGFKKSYFLNYIFSSKPELFFSRILESDNIVKKWLRPHKEQFEIYYKNSASKEQRYEADFVVETDTNKFIVEIKRSDQMDNFDVQAKKQSAIDFCNTVNSVTETNEWAYLLIPHDEIKPNYDFSYFIRRFRAEWV